MKHTQAGILAEETRLARYLTFSIDSEDEIETALQILANNIENETTVIGIGESVVNLLGKHIPGLHTLQAQTSYGIEIPSTPAALWCWLRGNDRGELFHRSREIYTY